jgi:hypothetical protein
MFIALRYDTRAPLGARCFTHVIRTGSYISLLRSQEVLNGSTAINISLLRSQDVLLTTDNDQRATDWDHGPRTTDHGLRTTDHGPLTTDKES